MIEFTLFGIPVRIHPMFWVGMAVLGGATGIREIDDILPVLLFMIAGTLAFLVHEFGHALSARYLTQSSSRISLSFFVALTEFNHHQVVSKRDRILITLAGPVASLIPGILAFLALTVFLAQGDLGLALRQSIALTLSPYAAYGYPQYFGGYGPECIQYFFLGCLMFTSAWWSVLNLLPIYPMDGGLVMSDLLRSQKLAHLVSIILAALIALVALLFLRSLLLFLFMAFFCIVNFRAWKASSY